MNQIHPILQPIVDALDPNPRLLMADAGVIITAIADVVDAGDPRNESGEWALWHPFEEVGTDARMAFAGAVIARIQELQRPPHNLGIKLENFCLYHMRARLPAATSSTCRDCDAEISR